MRKPSLLIAMGLISCGQGLGHECGHPFPGKAPWAAILAYDRSLDLGLDQHFVAALELLRHEDAGAGNVLGAGVDRQDVVDAGGAAKIDLHAAYHPDYSLAMLAVGKLGVVHACQPEIV